MIATHERPETRQKTLEDKVKEYLRFLDNPPVAIPYEARQELRRRHLGELREMVRGFTLVEMLVAVALVVLMMSIFTAIFQMATGSMARMKAIAEGDQRVRLVNTLLRNDIERRTFREVVPFVNSDDPQAATLNADPNQLRFGYFLIAENDPDDDTDDILQFTIKGLAGDDPVYALARAILPNGAGVYGPGNPPVADPLNPPPAFYWTNQPEFDDQLIGLANHAGLSENAEVCWFLRHGTLYRRTLVIRANGTPTDSTSAPLSTAAYESAGTRNFWTDFDYSAHYELLPPTPGIRWHGTNELDPTLSVFPLGRPEFRFGFDATTGLPRQYVQDTGGVWRYFGRFTHAETSFSNPTGATPPLQFGYPGRVDANALNPFAPATPLTYDSATDRFAEYSGSRIAEDMVMTQVHRFDVKVFDEAAAAGPDLLPGFAGVDDDGLNGVDDPAEYGWPGSDDGDFVNLGHAGRGFYGAAALQNPQPCPNIPAYAALVPPVNRPAYCFDSWNPGVNLDGVAGNDPPPFRAPDSATGRRPLRAIQITIAFFDTTSQTLRDLTIVYPLRPTP